MREGLTQTLLIVFGVALGAGVIIFMSALLAGLQANIIRRTLNYQAPIQILAPDQVARPLRGESGDAVAAQVQPRSQQLRSVDQWQKVRADVERMPDVDRRHAGRHRTRVRAARRGHQGRLDHRHRARVLLHGDRAAGEDRCRTLRRGPHRHRHRHRAREGPRHRVGDKLALSTGERGRVDADRGRHLRLRQQGRERAQRLRRAAHRAEPARPRGRRDEPRRQGARAVRRGDHRAGDPRRERPPGRQLDPHQRAVLHRRWRRRSSPTR